MKHETFIKRFLVIFALGLVPLTVTLPGEAAEMEHSAPEVEKKAQEPSGSDTNYLENSSYFFGYRFLSQEDSTKAAEYVYPESSITFGVDLLAWPLPHRYHLFGEFLSNYDFYADAGYAYKDLILFRDVLVGVHHNLDHLNYQFPGSSPSVLYTDRNVNDKYFIDYINNLVTLRLKTPDFPFHAFMKHRYVERHGNIEERFVLGDFANLVKTSATRAIDWDSNALTLGANSHLGPIEIEYAYDQADFDPGGNNVLYDFYPPSFIYQRPADIYPHSVVPETESSANTLKMHTSYTGGIVASATLSSLSQQNNYSGTESTTWKGAFDFSWIPDPVIGLFFKYRHKNLDMDNQDAVTLNGTVHTLNYPVRQGISYDRDQFFFTARYKPITSFSLLSTYEFSHLERDDIEEWPVLPEETDRHNLNLTALARPINKLKLKATYDYTYIDNPAYNTEPDSSNRLRLSATYLPLPWLTTYVDYVLALTERDDLRYMNARPRILLEGGERDGRSDRFLASLSAMVSPKATVTASWAYNKWHVEQDLLYARQGSGGLPFIDAGVPYTDEANSFSLAFQYLPREDITLMADVTYTKSEGRYETGNHAETLPLLLESYSALDTRETVFSVEAAKKLQNDWEIAVKFYMDIYDDQLGDVLDGELYITTLSLKRYF